MIILFIVTAFGSQQKVNCYVSEDSVYGLQFATNFGASSGSSKYSITEYLKFEFIILITYHTSRIYIHFQLKPTQTYWSYSYSPWTALQSFWLQVRLLHPLQSCWGQICSKGTPSRKFDHDWPYCPRSLPVSHPWLRPIKIIATEKYLERSKFFQNEKKPALRTNREAFLF